MFLNLKRFRIPLKLFVIAAALTLLDIFLVIFDIMPYSKLTAFITGFLLGSLGFLYFNRAIQNLLLEIRADREN
jgi:hypothetical protein